MKRLTLLRHGKSIPQESDVPDLKRPLSRRGEQDAPMMGERLRAYRARPSLILTSHAIRAKATAKIVARALGYPEEFMHVERALYLAPQERIVALIEGQDDRFGDILVVGHNPGLTDLVNRLLPELGLDNMPTCGAAAIDFEMQRWAELARAPRRLAFYDFPKNSEPVIVAETPSR
ncbi:MAG TPA: histidine phosphatase family protein [Gammaproteobacteria bacterium]|nr:histidine phosphatase family protein [Gammaproteobacteria bacterium]